jgi:ADP-ribosylglycohydrolase
VAAATALGSISNGSRWPRQLPQRPHWAANGSSSSLEILRSTIDVQPEVEDVIAGGFRREPPAIKGSGYVVRSLEAALWALNRSDDFESAVLAAVNLGDDADTTGAVCGQLAGAFWGSSRIPDELLAALAKRGMIETAAARLIAKGG